MPEIRALPPEEVEKIAAGEVVERPVSAVKELVENALDAGAQHITVEVADGGKQRIAIIDDGSGIPFAELALAVRNFHTSKIRACDDIYHQTTLGFRGEALAAIGAVSRLTITSRVGADEMGGVVQVEGGKASEPSRATLNRGTVVEVRELFFNTPVRRKFLRSRTTELNHIANMLRNYVLAAPEVSFKLVSEGKELLASGGRGLTPETLQAVFGAEVAPELTSFEREYPPMGVSGLVAPPSAYRETRQFQFFFVNGRPVKNRAIYRAVDDALREYVSPGRFPPLVLYLDIPPEEVDVNIHPTKNEVSFLHQQRVYSAIVVTLKDAIRVAAGEHLEELRQDTGALQPPVESGVRPLGVGLQHPPASRQREVPIYEMGAPLVTDGPSAAQADQARRRLAIVDETSVVSLARELGMPAYVHPEGRYFACQLDKAYILLVKEGRLTLIDQHAAHERVLFARLWARLGPEGAAELEHQRLLFPVAIALSAEEMGVWREQAELMQRLGFAVRFSKDEVLVDEVPRLLLARGDEERIGFLLAQLVASGHSSQLEAERKEAIADFACKSALKSGDLLKPAEMQLLLGELMALEDAASCPHGRPTMVQLTTEELAKLFRRT